jgi:hypothetical protein
VRPGCLTHGSCRKWSRRASARIAAATLRRAAGLLGSGALGFITLVKARAEVGTGTGGIDRVENLAAGSCAHDEQRAESRVDGRLPAPG